MTRILAKTRTGRLWLKYRIRSWHYCQSIIWRLSMNLIRQQDERSDLWVIFNFRACEVSESSVHGSPTLSSTTKEAISILIDLTYIHSLTWSRQNIHWIRIIIKGFPASRTSQYDTSWIYNLTPVLMIIELLLDISDVQPSILISYFLLLRRAKEVAGLTCNPQKAMKPAYIAAAK